jgi:hypothetical protein
VLSCTRGSRDKLRLHLFARVNVIRLERGIMAEISVAILVIGVLLVADPERLQALIDRLREVLAWLAE